MEEQQALLRAIPQVDELLREPPLPQAAILYGHAAARGAVRDVLDHLRAEILRGNRNEAMTNAALAQLVQETLERRAKPSLRGVLNATGVALHTNLGRAPLAREALDAAETAAGGYSNLEYDLETGTRGNRGTHIEPLLRALCGCEDALVVNNNAAAVLLALTALARGKDILVSRGELVEIGDSFRVPDIMAQSGGRLVEVGSTNKTHPRDYENAISAQTGVLLKVHTSNFRVVGFTGAVGIRELAALGGRHGIPTVADLGSGALMETDFYPFTDEPTVPQALRDGADVVCFSGDKLLGGPQAGILLGKRALIERMRRHPLARALRIDKLSLAALEATLRLYQNPDRARERIPVLRAVCAGASLLRESAETLCALLEQAGADCAAAVIPHSRPVGGGCAPEQLLDGYAVALSPRAVSVSALEQRLRRAGTPVVALAAQGRLLLDVSTLQAAELPLLARELADCLRERSDAG